jgi:hypothetical protein
MCVSSPDAHSIGSQPAREKQLCLEEPAAGSAHFDVDVRRTSQERTRDDRAQHVASVRVRVLTTPQLEAFHVVLPLSIRMPEVEEDLRKPVVALLVQDATAEGQQNACDASWRRLCRSGACGLYSAPRFRGVSSQAADFDSGGSDCAAVAIAAATPIRAAAAVGTRTIIATTSSRSRPIATSRPEQRRSRWHLTKGPSHARAASVLQARSLRSERVPPQCGPCGWIW